MSFPRYPSYKDSGVEWLGEVPAHWDVKPMWTFFRRVKRVGFESEQLLSVYRDYGVIPKASRDDNFNKPSDDLSVYQLVVPGDLAINKMKAWQGSVAVSDCRGIVSPAYFIYEALHDSNRRFLHHLFRSPRYIGGYLSHSKGIRPNQWDLEPEVHSRFPVLVPTSAEQTAIAEFLDRETRKIDELVAEQRRLMELLKEKRQAVISHAVTRGLNPQAQLKPSGIEWLGDVPKHWEVKPLKYAIKLTSGGTPSKDNLAYWDGDVPWASSKDLKVNELFDTQDHITQLALDEGAADVVPAGTILTVVRGMILLHTFPVVLTRVPMAINQDLKAITPKTGMNVEYLAWLLRGSSSEVLSRTDEAAHGTKVLRLEAWLSMEIPIPPLSEQTAIVAHLERELAKFDTLTAEAQRAIDLLQERRTALISAAVTGQIDVRAAVG